MVQAQGPSGMSLRRDLPSLKRFGTIDHLLVLFLQGARDSGSRGSSFLHPRIREAVEKAAKAVTEPLFRAFDLAASGLDDAEGVV